MAEFWLQGNDLQIAEQLGGQITVTGSQSPPVTSADPTQQTEPPIWAAMRVGFWDVCGVRTGVICAAVRRRAGSLPGGQR